MTLRTAPSVCCREPVPTTARPVGTKAQAGSVNVSFAFGKLADSDRERLELLIFDTVLDGLAKA